MDFDTAEECGIRTLFETYHTDITMDWEQFRMTFKRVAQEFFDQYSAGILTFEQQRIKRVAETFALNGHSLDAKESENRFWTYWNSYEENYLTFNDVIPMLDELRKLGIGMGIITNGDSANQRGKLERAGITGYFDPIIISGEVGTFKPDVGIFKLAMEKAGTSVADTWYVGDSLVHDVEPGIKLGLNTVHLDRKMTGTEINNEKLENGNTFARIKNFSEFLRLISN